MNRVFKIDSLLVWHEAVNHAIYSTQFLILIMTNVAPDYHNKFNYVVFILSSNSMAQEH